MIRRLMRRFGLRRLLGRGLRPPAPLLRFPPYALRRLRFGAGPGGAKSLTGRRARPTLDRLKFRGAPR